jgi:hypothetical protein
MYETRLVIRDTGTLKINETINRIILKTSLATLQ